METSPDQSIHDNRFLRLVENLLKAGYCQQWLYHGSHSGTPQGGVVSPLLANIYLDRLDRYVEQTLLPAYTRGERRKRNPEWNRATCKCKYYQRRGRHEEAKVWDQARR